MEPIIGSFGKYETDLRNIKTQLHNYMDSRFTLRDVYLQIQAKSCPLPKRVRDYVLAHFDKDGNFNNGDF